MWSEGGLAIMWSLWPTQRCHMRVERGTQPHKFIFSPDNRVPALMTLSTCCGTAQTEPLIGSKVQTSALLGCGTTEWTNRNIIHIIPSCYQTIIPCIYRPELFKRKYSIRVFFPHRGHFDVFMPRYRSCWKDLQQMLRRTPVCFPIMTKCQNVACDNGPRQDVEERLCRINRQMTSQFWNAIP